MGVELTRHDFYQRLPGYKIPPTTSSPGIDAFIHAYEQAILDGDSGIVSVHVSANFSNLINMARLAAETVTTVPITLVDSGQLSLGEGLLALAAAEASQKEATQAEIVSQIRDMAQRTYIFGILDTLEYLRRSGRASRLKASLSLWLDIKPVFIVNQGEVTIEKTRTRRKATERLLRQIEEMSPLERVALDPLPSIYRTDGVIHPASTPTLTFEWIFNNSRSLPDHRHSRWAGCTRSGGRQSTPGPLLA